MKREIAFYLIKAVNWIIPKKQKIIFTSSPSYTDNSRAVFEKAYERYTDSFQMAWLLEDDTSVEEKRDVVYVNRHSLKGFWHFCTSKYIICTHGLYLNAFVKRQYVFNLWHGMPIKKIQHIFPKDMKDVANRHFRSEAILATSDYMGKIMKYCFACGDEKIRITGLPRNDYLFMPERFRGIPKDARVIAWLPTYRNSNSWDEGKSYEYGVPLLDDASICRMNEVCKNSNVYIVLKMHPLQLSQKKIDSYSNILLLSPEMYDKDKLFYQYLGGADALLTDYSSVYIDYLEIDRPIGFVLDDMNDYATDRGFVFDNITDYMPGSLIYSIEDLIAFIKEIGKGIDSTKQKRDMIGKLLNVFHDGESTERFLRVLGEYLDADED